MKPNLTHRPGKHRPVWPDDQRALSEMLAWSDAELHEHSARTAELVAAGLDRDQAARRAFRELRPGSRCAP